MTTPVERCWSNGNKVVFPTKAEADAALPRFRADWNGQGQVRKCYPHDHYHLTKGRKGRKGKSSTRNRTERAFR